MRTSVSFGRAASTLVCMLAVGMVAMAQPPEGGEGPANRPAAGRGPGRGPFVPPPDPVRDALDADGDGTLDADEIKNAATALLALDEDGDGVISAMEFAPPRMGPPAGFGRPGQPGNGGGRFRPAAESRGARGPAGDGQPPRRPAAEAEDPPGPGQPEAGRDGPRRPGGPQGGFGGQPSPERFVERAMGFDKDGDGKLDRTELEAFAEQMMQGMRRPGGPGRPGRPE